MQHRTDEMGVPVNGEVLGHQIWLDVPPPEVRERIAVHVSGGQFTQTALHLAQVNEKQREAVVSVVSKALHVNDTEDPKIWANLLQNELVALSFDYGCRCPDYAFDLLRAPKLRSASIPDDPELLKEVAKSSVTELTIIVCGRASPTLLFDTLASLPLTKLQLFCNVDEESRCFNNPDFVGPNAFALAVSCPRVTEFQTECSCPHEHDLIWRALPMLAELRKLTILELPDDSLERLAGLESIKIHSALDVQSLAKQLGPVVSDVVFPCDFLDARQIESLMRCTQLSSLRCMVKEQTEFALADLIKKSLSLSILEVYWGCAEVPREKNIRQPSPFYATVTPRVLLCAISTGVNLTVLILCHVHIPLSELTSMLKSVGRRLHEFGTSIMGQEEEPLDRLESVLFAATKHCPNLKGLGIFEHAPELALGIEKAFKPLPPEQECRLFDVLSCFRGTGTFSLVDKLRIAKVRHRVHVLLTGLKAFESEGSLERLLARPLSRRGCRVLAALSRLQTSAPRVLSRLQTGAPRVRTEVLELMIRLLDMWYS